MIHHQNMDEQWLKKIPLPIGAYLTGFTDGEGSFNVLLRKKDYSVGWQACPSFNVSQKDRTILALFKRWLGCGTLRSRPDGITYYEVTNIKSLEERILPFFQKFHFLSASKKTNFRIFREIIELMAAGEHLNQDGFKKLLELRERLNRGHSRKRKYNINDVLESR